MTSEGDARPPVVVGVDGSEGSVAALRWAVRYGAATGTPVRAVLVWHYPTVAAQEPVGHAPEEINQEVQGEEVGILREAIARRRRSPLMPMSTARLSMGTRPRR
jgi:nucleotide-binding universal stress UspA family protein